MGRVRPTSGTNTNARIIGAYALLLPALAMVATVAFRVGQDLAPTHSIAGAYTLTVDSDCLGERNEQLRLRQSGQFVDADTSQGATGQLWLRSTTLAGEMRCRNGKVASIGFKLLGIGSADLRLQGSVDGEGVVADRESASDVMAVSRSNSKRSAEETFGRLMLAIAVVVLAARLVGAAVARIGQPQVMGEVLAGILLGPTLLGGIAPQFKEYLFPVDIVPLLGAGADIGLAFFMFLVGLELDPNALRGRVGQAALISNVSAALPMMLGVAIALPIYGLLGPDRPFVPFALFMGISMSITAFPVLARILLERRMLQGPVGTVALSSAAVDDVTAWTLLALATAVAGTGSGFQVIRILGLAAFFCALMAVAGRRLLARVSRAYDEAGRVPAGWVATIFVGILISSFLAQQIGIAAIFGAFVMGLIMPRRSDLTQDVNRRVEDFVVTVLLPLFFVVTGLKTEVGLLNRPELWLVTVGLIGVAILGKWLGAMGAARLTGSPLREAAAIGVLMNTRGLTELIVLNIGLDLGVITPALFTMLVVMALITTFMAGPALRLIDRKREFSAPVTQDLRVAERVGTPPGVPLPQRAILVASLEERNFDALLGVAEPLARYAPPRELILVRLVVPSRISTGLVASQRDLAAAAAELARRRRGLADRQVAVRVIAFTSGDLGEDLVRLSSEAEVDLALVDGRRPLLGEAVPGGPVGPLLAKAPCDVAIFVATDGNVPQIGPERPVIVPFGGAEHDWAALELGAWIANVRGAPLRLLGATATPAKGKRDASRLLADASLVVQQFAGIAAEPMLAEPGREGVLAAAQNAGLLIVGLSERWRQEGLGPVRSEIARLAPAPMLYVRRGQRPGALRSSDGTRFEWSRAGTRDGGDGGQPA